MHPRQSAPRDDRARWRTAQAIRGLTAAIAAAACVASSNAAFAAGQEEARCAHDLAVHYDTRWAGCHFGGYYPIRIRVTNKGPARNLTFRFNGGARDRNMPTVERTVGVEQNATVRFSLSVPMAGAGSHGAITVFHAGKQLTEFSWFTSLADYDYSEQRRPATLVISADEKADGSKLGTAVLSMFRDQESGRTYYGYGGAPKYDDIAVIPPSSTLPEGWIDYSGLDLIVVPLETLNAMASAPREAMLSWVQTGGTLIVTQVGERAESSEGLRRVLGPVPTGGQENWVAADLSLRTAPSVLVEPDASQASGVTSRVVEEAEMTRTLTDEESFAWPAGGDAFQIRRMMLGRVVAIPGDPFPGRPGDWMWVLKTIGAADLLWGQRHGITTRRGHHQFLEFEIPGLRGVPVVSFLILMTFFALLIGPLNYFVLWKRRQLWLLAASIPAFAFVTSASLFAYSTISHGFGVKSRTRSFTLLDQRTHTAVTTARLSLFAGIAPSRGLQFSTDTAVYPVWSNAVDSIEPGTTDWTIAQELNSGWLRARTRTQFLTVAHRTERGRLAIKTPSEGRLAIENGFPWDIEAVIVAGADGKRYVGGAVPKGASASLAEARSPEDSALAVSMLGRHAPQIPDGAAQFQSSYGYGYGSRRYRGVYYAGYDQGNREFIRFENNLMERELRRLGRLSQDASALPAGSYLIVFRDSPGVETGLDETREQAPLHVLLGRY